MAPSGPAFRVRRTLGAGASAIVVQAQALGQTSLPDLFALKICLPSLNPSQPTQEELTNEQCFVSEASLMAGMSCPFIIAGYGLVDCPPSIPGFPKDFPQQTAKAMALEFMEAGSLARMLVKTMTEGRSLYTNQEAYQILLDVAMGLLYLHSRSPAMAHRDLKMENLLLTRRHGRLQCKIADLGLHAVMDRTLHQSLLRRKASCAVPDAPGKQPRLFFAHTDAEPYTEDGSSRGPPTSSTGTITTMTASSRPQSQSQVAAAPVTQPVAQATAQQPTQATVQPKAADAAAASPPPVTAAVEVTDKASAASTAAAIQAAVAVPADAKGNAQATPNPAGLLSRALSQGRAAAEKAPAAKIVAQAGSPARVQINMALVAGASAAGLKSPSSSPSTCLIPKSPSDKIDIASMSKLTAATLSDSQALTCAALDSVPVPPLRSISQREVRENTSGHAAADREAAVDLSDRGAQVLHADSPDPKPQGDAIVPMTLTDVLRSVDQATAPAPKAQPAPTSPVTSATQTVAKSPPTSGTQAVARSPVTSATKPVITSPTHPIIELSSSEEDSDLDFTYVPPPVARLAGGSGTADTLVAQLTRTTSRGGESDTSAHGGANAVRGGTGAFTRASFSRESYGNTQHSGSHALRKLASAYGSGPGLNSQLVIAQEAGDSLFPLPNDRNPSLGAGLSAFAAPAQQQEGGIDARGDGGLVGASFAFDGMTLDIPDPTHTAPASLSPQGQPMAGSLSQASSTSLYPARGPPMARALTLAGKRSLYHFSPPSPDQFNLLSRAVEEQDEQAHARKGGLFDKMARTWSKLGLSSLAGHSHDNEEGDQAASVPGSPRVRLARARTYASHGADLFRAAETAGAARALLHGDGVHFASQTPDAGLPTPATSRFGSMHGRGTSSNGSGPGAAGGPGSGAGSLTKRFSAPTPAAGGSPVLTTPPVAPAQTHPGSLRAPDELLETKSAATAAAAPEHPSPQSLASPLSMRRRQLATKSKHLSLMVRDEVAEGDAGVGQQLSPGRKLQRVHTTGSGNKGRSVVQPVLETASRASTMERSRSRNLDRPVTRILSPEFAFVYNLTGSTGSSMYMAPEVCRHEPYNESVDTYSFAVVMYEVLSRTMLIFTHVGQGRVAEDADGYAEAASKGYRPEQPPHLDPSAWELITACWAQDPLERPPMKDVVRRLQDIIARLPYEKPIQQGCCRTC